MAKAVKVKLSSKTYKYVKVGASKQRAVPKTKRR
jgi:hypothetical protein